MTFNQRLLYALALAVGLILIAWFVPKLWAQRPPVDASGVLIYQDFDDTGLALHFTQGGLHHFIRVEELVMIQGRAGQRTSLVTTAGAVSTDHTLEDLMGAMEDYRARNRKDEEEEGPSLETPSQDVRP